MSICVIIKNKNRIKTKIKGFTITHTHSFEINSIILFLSTIHNCNGVVGKKYDIKNDKYLCFSTRDKANIFVLCEHDCNSCKRKKMSLQLSINK